MAGTNTEALRLHLAEEFTPAPHQKGFYICPYCGSGSHGHGSTAGLSIRANKVNWKCFACDRGGDIFDKALYDMGVDPSGATKDQKAEAFRRVAERYNFPLTGSRPSAAQDFSTEPAAPAPAAPPPETCANYLSMLNECSAALPGSEGEEYLYKRGIGDWDIINKFMLGYDRSHYFPGRGTFPAIIGSYDKEGHYVFWRAIPTKHYDKPSAEEAGEEPVFNADALYCGSPVFVVESQLCAISIEQAGGHAVAIGGSGAEKLLKQLRMKPASGLLILSLDNDNPGQAQEAKLSEKLEAAGINFIHFNVAGGFKDPNELLQNDPAALRDLVSGGCEVAEAYAADLKEKAIKEEEERLSRTGAGMIDSFMADVQTRMYEPIPTGITDIDKALDGGFMRQQLICLGAAPGAGKTALAQWIFEGMAAKGISCVFLNLEMSRNQMLARSISRFAARNGHKISNVKALRGYGWSEEQKAAIMAAAEEYKRTVAPRMIYNPDEVSSNLDSILAYIEKEAERAESIGNPAPCIVLDYLQILTGKDREDSVELIKRAVFSLKRFAVEHNTIVFLIMAHNRQSNSSGTITMESGRDTSAIEYSGDTQIGLTFTRCLKGWIDEYGAKHDKSKNPDDLSEKERQEITLKIVKSRFGGVGRTVNLRFNGETMTYTQTVNEFSVVDEKTPFEDDEGWKPIP